MKIDIFLKTIAILGIFLFLFVGSVSRKSSSLRALVSKKKLVKVTQVIDGDTIKIAGGETVRYIGIDAPETVDPRKSVECFGKEAYLKNKELVEGKMVRLERDMTDKDKYHRLLRYVWVDDRFFNLELVREGFAYADSYSSDIKYQAILIQAQQEAQSAKRGLWSRCAY